MKKRKTLSLCMIVKNEARYLEQCLSSVKSIVDEMIIVDTGSTDDTLAIAKSFGAKVFEIEWQNDFSAARNFSIEQATSDWLLLLDADEALDADSKDELLKFINASTLDGCHFIMYNYVGTQVNDQFTIHYPFRLLRNNHHYAFTGTVHEQITCMTGPTLPERFATTDKILVHHYGYLQTTIKEKDKRSRNMAILFKQLKENPHNAFTLFNLGNEYLSLEDFPKAIETYEQARAYLDPTQPYAPYLYHRLTMALYLSRNYPLAITRAEEGIALRPNCADIHFCKGLAQYALHQYTLAISTFNHCLALGEPPLSLKFNEGCGTYKPYLLLAEIYQRLQDFDEALRCYTAAINVNPKLFPYLYQIGENLNQKYTDKHIVSEELRRYFFDFNYGPNRILFMDILIKQQLYEEASAYLAEFQQIVPESMDRSFILGTYYFYTHAYDVAYNHFEAVLSQPSATNTLGDVKKQSMIYLFLITALTKKQSLTEPLALIKTLNEPTLESVFLQFEALYTGSSSIYLADEAMASMYLQHIMDYLDKILRLKEFDFFEASLYILNTVSSKKVLLELGKLYARHQLNTMAVKTLLQSVKELDILDQEGASILSRYL